MKFIGREKELAALERLLAKTSSSLVVIWGRRRIGKSRLINEYLKNKKSWDFIGLPPTHITTKEDQIDIFAGQMARNIGMPKLQSNDWAEIFWHLGNQAEKEKSLIIVLDEISWIGSKDPHFLGHLKTEWDRSFSKHPNLILILCGSVSSWIDKNILSSTGFLGRISLNLQIQEFSLVDCNEFWLSKKNRISGYEKLKLLSITGGVPKYLEEILPHESAESNILRLCFSPDGPLYREYSQIFSDLFDKRAPTFDKIVRQLCDGVKDLNQLSKELGIEKSGNISSYLQELITAGFVSEDTTWNILKKTPSNLKKFRLKDNYIRFYLKFIEPNKIKIEHGSFSLESFNGWETVLALQFENLVLNNINQISKLIGIHGYEVAGPFFQRNTKQIQGCQVDLLIETKSNTLYLCEIKFSRSPIGKEIIMEVQDKIERLKYPKGFSIRPVLIHVNGVSASVIESDFFDTIIDFSQLLKG